MTIGSNLNHCIASKHTTSVKRNFYINSGYIVENSLAKNKSWWHSGTRRADQAGG